MPLKVAVKEKLEQVNSKIRDHRVVETVKKFHVKHVISKLRTNEGKGWRRILWVLLAIALAYQGWTFVQVSALLICLAILLFIALPFVFKYSTYIQRHLIFLPSVKLPRFIDYEDPESEGIPGGRNFYLYSEPGVKIGVWQILPEDIKGSHKTHSVEWFEEQLQDGRTVILYLHGNSNDRAGPHRVELYHVLRKMGYHVFAFDYRGYADSTQVPPSETGVVLDAMTVYNWIKTRIGDAKLIVWGHSLGTAVSSHLVSDLCLQGNRPSGLVLESPFNNIYDEIRNHPMAWVWRKMPYFDWFSSTLENNDFGFVSDQRIEVIDVPILIMHAKDDMLVPFILGQALYESAVRSRDATWPQVEFVEFESEHGYAHKYICRAPELPSIIRKFEARSIKKD
eukprot:TRINITY_DN34217_c0_g1_i1.p1 TRINITY_DN34217_c0_g1~~TRINITY_DN34217_c0_g1_i1.p1  ORF type:complete len:395 (+),score=56.75 TRINITY_DN34217_c0_g1_i1:196-1380(+)